MKKTLSLLLLLLSITSLAQQNGNIVLEWVDNSKISYGEFSIRVPFVKSENFHYDEEKQQFFYNLRVPQSGPVAENALKITNVVYESIPQSQLSEIRTTGLPSDINATIKNIQARDKFFAHISLSLIIKDGSGFKRVKSFTYTIAASGQRNTMLPGNTSAITNSVLATGDWYRFYVEKSGVYKISKSFLQSLGMSVTVDPRKIKIYGNGGRMLPLPNSVFYPFDLVENALQFVGEADGTFDSQDYILFYAEGVDAFSSPTESDTNNNLYADRSYYYVTVKGDDGKRIPAMDPLTGSTLPITPVTIFDDYQFHEKDLINPVRLGRRWFGEQFGINDEQQFEFTFPNIVTTSPIEIKVYAAAAAFTSTSLSVQANDQTVGNIGFGSLGVGGSIQLSAGIMSAGTFPAAQNVTVKLTYNNGGVPTSRAYLDYVALKAKRNLTGYGKQFRFQYNESATSTGIGNYQFSNASGITQVWDITDIYNVTKAENTTGSSFSFKAVFGELRKFIAIDPADYYTPLKETQSRVANQDLKGTIFNNAQGVPQDIDYLIITPANLNTQAEKLANFHRNYSQLYVKVVTLESIYQEFSSGKQDISAIRNFVKYVYDNKLTTPVKYLNLFGDASFDFKDRIPDNTNIVPIYHILNGYSSGQTSFASDDFFTCMDANEGNMNTYNASDIAVGRMILDNAQQADDMVIKVIDYHDLKSYGSWRNNIMFIGDDADKDSDSSIQQNQNNLSDLITTERPFFNSKKIFLDSYIQETSAGGDRYPKARQDVFNSFEKGALVFNYLGHGGEDGLAFERIWEKVDGETLQNRYKYPLFITITCEFSRFDNPYRPTAGEYTFWNPKGGAISMLTTIRSISQSQGETFNSHLSKYLFNYGVGAGPQTSIAEALRLAKTTGGDSGSNVVFYLGDPALFLAIPKPKIRLTKVNDQPITGPIDDFKSLAYMKISGEVVDENDTPLPSYNGELSVNIFDKPIMRTTLNNDGNAPSMPFSVLGETIFRGNASITNGQFEFGFVVPRDIRIPVDEGRISFYSKRNEILLDKTGYDMTIKVGGINENAVADNIGPTVKLYMNDQTFISGGITNESPIFLAYLEDEHGINTASGIGHDIVAILDGDENNPFILNDYYETELDDYTKGKLRFPLRNLEKGLHTITFTAWDVYNNRVTAEIQFIVVGDEGITLKNVLNYPNPFVNYTQFWFTHNRPFEPLEVQVQVLTVTGKVVWTKNQIVTTDGFLSREITWDGKDDFGDRIGKGVYVYKLTVKSTVTNTQTEKYEKLVIL